MHVSHQTFERLLESREVDILWRYMNFDKFVSLLTTSSLHLSRIDTLKDAREGRWPIRGASEADDPDSVDPEETARIRKKFREQMFVSCWCAAKEELLPMWGLYTDDQFGIAMMTDLESLKESLCGPGQEFISPVIYEDWNEEHGSLTDPMLPTIFKRDVFSFEQEVRIIRWPWAEELMVSANMADRLGLNLPAEGLSVVKNFHNLEYENQNAPVDLTKLVKKILVTPNAEDWITTTVRELVDKFELDVSVDKSRI